MYSNSILPVKKNLRNIWTFELPCVTTRELLITQVWEHMMQPLHTHTHIHTHAYIYIYIYIVFFGPVKPELGVIPSGQA